MRRPAQNSAIAWISLPYALTREAQPAPGTAAQLPPLQHRCRYVGEKTAPNVAVPNEWLHIENLVTLRFQEKCSRRLDSSGTGYRAHLPNLVLPDWSASQEQPDCL